MLHTCVAVSCLSLGALLGRRGSSRGVAQAASEEACSVVLFYFGRMDSLKIRCVFGLGLLNWIYLSTSFKMAEWN